MHPVIPALLFYRSVPKIFYDEENAGNKRDDVNYRQRWFFKLQRLKIELLHQRTSYYNSNNYKCERYSLFVFHILLVLFCSKFKSYCDRVRLVGGSFRFGGEGAILLNRTAA